MRGKIGIKRARMVLPWKRLDARRWAAPAAVAAHGRRRARCAGCALAAAPRWRSGLAVAVGWVEGGGWDAPPPIATATATENRDMYGNLVVDSYGVARLVILLK